MPSRMMHGVALEVRYEPKRCHTRQRWVPRNDFKVKDLCDEVTQKSKMGVMKCHFNKKRLVTCKNIKVNVGCQYVHCHKKWKMDAM